MTTDASGLDGWELLWGQPRPIIRRLCRPHRIDPDAVTLSGRVCGPHAECLRCGRWLAVHDIPLP